jgi:hypothetical protein
VAQEQPPVIDVPVASLPVRAADAVAGDIAIRAQHHARAGLADLLDQRGVPWSVEHAGRGL